MALEGLVTSFKYCRYSRSWDHRQLFQQQCTRGFATDCVTQVLNHLISHPSPHFQVFGTLIEALLGGHWKSLNASAVKDTRSDGWEISTEFWGHLLKQPGRVMKVSGHHFCSDAMVLVQSAIYSIAGFTLQIPYVIISYRWTERHLQRATLPAPQFI